MFPRCVFYSVIKLSINENKLPIISHHPNTVAFSLLTLFPQEYSNSFFLLEKQRFLNYYVCSFISWAPFLEHGIPTSVDFIGCDPAHMVTPFNTGSTVIYDLETQSLVMLSSQMDSGKFSGKVETLKRIVLQ